MPTDWDLVGQANSDEPAVANAARRRLLEPYCRPAWKYLAVAMRDPDKADELVQDFAVRFMRGDFRHVARGKGELGAYIKTALGHLVVEFHERERHWRAMQDLALLAEEPAAGYREPSTDGYRNAGLGALLDLAWQALERLQNERPDQPHYMVLRLHMLLEDESYEQLAGLLSRLLERQLTANAVAIRVHEARGHFAAALWSAASQVDGDADEVRAFLQDLGVWKHLTEFGLTDTGGSA